MEYMGLFSMIFEKILLGKILFGKICTSDTECEYKSICSSYQNDSYTCKHEVDKRYCGNYRMFL